MVDFLTMTQMPEVNKGPWVVGYFYGLDCAGDSAYILPKVVMVKPDSWGSSLELEGKVGYVDDKASGSV